jgi:hypothetical protein
VPPGTRPLSPRESRAGKGLPRARPLSLESVIARVCRQAGITPDEVAPQSVYRAAVRGAARAAGRAPLLKR